MSCEACRRLPAKTEFGAYVYAYLHTRKKPWLRKEVIRRARALFLIKGNKRAVSA